MNVRVRPVQAADSVEPSPEREAAAKAAASWVQQLARTLKTCRLYDSKNPTVVRFRQELAGALERLIEEHGVLELRFTDQEISFEGLNVYAARSRDDNLALLFHRDGVRGLTFSPGVEPREVEALVDALMRTSGPSDGDDDLVTLLWEAHLGHLEVDYVPAQGDAGSGSSGAESAILAPWPKADASGEEGFSSAVAAAAAAVAEAADEAGPRSDDWSIGELTAGMEASFGALEATAPDEVRRLQEEFEAEHREPVVSAALRLARAFVAAGARPDDMPDLAQFLPRVLKEAVAQAGWREAGEAIAMLEQCGTPEWAPPSFAQELSQPDSISALRERLEHGSPATVAEFIAFVSRLGEPAVDVFMLVLAEIQNVRCQRQLGAAVIERCRSNPERLAPWLSNPRWVVVRNAVQILGSIGGNAIAGLLEPVVLHPEPRVRHEVLMALRQVDPRIARPLLIRMLDVADTRAFCSVLQQLSLVRDPDSSRLILHYLKEPDFDGRSIEEKRATYSALSAAGGDEVVPELEAELHKGAWFARSLDTHRQAVARCLARIGTPLARTALERGAQSRRAAVRKACEEALQRFGHRE